MSFLVTKCLLITHNIFFKNSAISHISSAFNIKHRQTCFKTIKVKLWFARLPKPTVIHRLELT